MLKTSSGGKFSVLIWNWSTQFLLKMDVVAPDSTTTLTGYPKIVPQNMNCSRSIEIDQLIESALDVEARKYTSVCTSSPLSVQTHEVCPVVGGVVHSHWNCIKSESESHAFKHIILTLASVSPYIADRAFHAGHRSWSCIWPVLHHSRHANFPFHRSHLYSSGASLAFFLPA